MHRTTRVTVTIATAAVVAGAGVGLAAAVSAQEPTTKAVTTDKREVARSGPDIASVARQLAEARREVSALERRLAQLRRDGGSDGVARLGSGADRSGQTAFDRAADPEATGTDDTAEQGTVVRAPEESVRQQPSSRSPDDDRVGDGDDRSTNEPSEAGDPREDDEPSDAADG